MSRLPDSITLKFGTPIIGADGLPNELKRDLVVRVIAREGDRYLWSPPGRDDIVCSVAVEAVEPPAPVNPILGAVIGGIAQDRPGLASQLGVTPSAPIDMAGLPNVMKVVYGALAQDERYRPAVERIAAEAKATQPQAQPAKTEPAKAAEPHPVVAAILGGIKGAR
jgi:hypothetical protein